MSVVLVDGSALAYRSYYAFVRNPLRTSKGEETSLVFGFMNTLLRLFRRLEPEAVLVVFDAPGPTFRHTIDPAYKAERPPMPDAMRAQMPRLQELLNALRVQVVQVPTYEADDVLATLATRRAERGETVYLLSGDKDLLQLVSEHVRVLRFRRSSGDVEEVDPETLRAELGIEPAQVVDYLALTGDPVDNVPGVPGVGPQTARRLLERFGSLDAVFTNLDAIEQPALRRKLEAGRELALRSRELVRLHRDVPLPDDARPWSLEDADWSTVSRLLRELEFHQLLELLPHAALESPRVAWQLVADAAGVRAAATRLGTAQSLVVHAVHRDPDGPRGPLAGVVFGEPPGPYDVVRLAAGGATAQLELGGGGDVDGCPRESVAAALAPLLGDRRVAKLGYGLKRAARDLGVDLRLGSRSFDARLAAYVLDPGRRTPSLEVLALEVLGRRLAGWGDAVTQAGRRPDVGRLPATTLGERLAAAAASMPELRTVLAQRLRDAALERLFEDVEMPLLEVLLRMERTGVRIDPAPLRRFSDELDRRCVALQEAIFARVGHEFNLNSPQQLGKVLFEELHLPHGRRGKTGWRTDVSVLERLAVDDPVAAQVLEFRQLRKLQSTYAEALPRLIDPRTGRVHTRFNQTVASTGRLSSSDPNLQNIPIRTELGRRIREAFVPGERGWVMLSADYSQIELRLMAHLSGDARLREAFLAGGDVHRLTAARIAGCTPEAVRPEQRDAAKTVNFGILYGMGARGLASQLGIPVPEARRFIDEYFETYPGVRRYIDTAVARARERGWVETVLGRRLRIPDLDSAHPAQRAFAERVAVNAPIQGSAADLIKVAMVRIAARLERERTQAHMLLQVHDELLFEVAEPEREALARVVREEMAGAADLEVPLEVEIGVGANWSEAH